MSTPLTPEREAEIRRWTELGIPIGPSLCLGIRDLLNEIIRLHAQLPEGLPEGMRIKRVRREALGDHYGFYVEQWIAELEPIESQPASHVPPTSERIGDYDIPNPLLDGSLVETLPMWRVGNKVPLNVYEGDRPVCQCHNAEDAQRIVAAFQSSKEKQDG